MSLQSGLDDVAVFTVTRPGLDLARRVEASLPARVTVYVSAKYAGDAPPHYVRFAEKLQPVVDEAWSRHEALVFIGAAGIAVRAIAPHVVDKRFDPGVVVMDIAGKHAIALCSGHLGGANELAHRLGAAVGARPVVTTGTDVVDTLAPDVLAKELGADIENWEALKGVSGALVHGQPVGVLVDPGVEVDIARYEARGVRRVERLEGVDAGVAITAHLVDSAVPTLFIRPRTLVLGIGCNSGTAAQEIGEVVDAVLAESRLSPLSVREVATIEQKAGEPGLLAFCAARKWPLRALSARQINEEAPPFERSETVFRHVGVYGVSEPASMLAAGAVRCLVAKQKRGNVTVAVSRLGDGAPAPRSRRVAENAERVGLVLVHTGEGKGKSTSAFGLAARATGHGQRVHVVQFIKGSRVYGELAAMAKLGVTVERAGEGFTWEVRSGERQSELAAWGLARARAALAAGVDLLVLDEVNVALGKGFLDVESLIALLRGRPEGVHVVCTGRNAPAELVEFADLVTRHELVKHPFQRGVRAQPGVEF